MKKYYEENEKSSISKKRFHYRLASEEDNLMISGYKFNSVTPINLNISIPIIVS